MIRISNYKAFYFCLAALIAMPTVSCSFDNETWVTEKRLEVGVQHHAEQIPTSEMSDELIDAIASNYYKTGEGPVSVVVTYDPHSSKYSAMKATDEMARIAHIMKRNGVEDINASILPVNNQPHSVTLVSYDAYYAQGPSDCKDMLRISDEGSQSYDGYEFGCSLETQIAQQVANPKDLLGREGIGRLDGRRQANIVDDYKTGRINRGLDGETASDL